METFWGWAASLRSFLARFSPVIALACGAAACRIAFGWSLSTAKVTDVLPFDMPTPHLIVVFGELVTWAALAAIYSRRAARRRTALLVSAAFSAQVAGALGIAACMSPLVTLPAVLCVLSCLLIGMGRAATMVLWLEALGRLESERFVLGLSLVYLIDLAVYWLLDHLDVVGSLALVLVTLPCAYVTYAIASLPAKSEPDREGELRRQGNSCRQDDPGAAPGPLEPPPARYELPVKTLLWCVAFSLAYGLGSSYTGMGNSSMAMHIGYAVPAALVVCMMAAAPERFDLRSVFAVSLALMSVGLLMIAFLGSFVWLTQVAMSAADSGVYLLLFTLVCTRARQAGTSPLIDCSVALLVSSFCIQVGKLMGDLAAQVGMMALTSALLIAAIVAGYVIVARERTYLATNGPSERRDATDDRPDPTAVLAGLTEGRGLTEREQAVYLLLAKGRNVKQISDSLFIAQSTVRVHVSRIYEKFGVHTRQEFDALVVSELIGASGGESPAAEGQFEV